MPIEGVAASRPAIRYIDVIARFKEAVRKGNMFTPEFQRQKRELANYYKESRGSRKRRRSDEIDYLSRHGEVVDALHSWRNSSFLPQGGRLVKNVYIDMGVAVGHELVEVFEVKTSATRSDVYAAIGQLMVHGASKGCRRVVVLPQKEPIGSDLNDALRRLNIKLLKFKLNEKVVTIV